MTSDDVIMLKMPHSVAHAVLGEIEKWIKNLLSSRELIAVRQQSNRTLLDCFARHLVTTHDDISA